MAGEMRKLADAHPGIARIDGRGLHWTIEFHGPDWPTGRATTRTPSPPASPTGF